MISFFPIFSFVCSMLVGTTFFLHPSELGMVGGWRQSFYHPSNRPYWPHWLLRRRLRRGGILFNSPLDCIFRGPYQLVVDQAGQVDFKYWKGDQTRVEQLSVTQKSNSYEFCSETREKRQHMQSWLQRSDDEYLISWFYCHISRQDFACSAYARSDWYSSLVLRTVILQPQMPQIFCINLE